MWLVEVGKGEKKGLSGFSYTKSHLELVYKDSFKTLSLVEKTYKGKSIIFELSYKTGIVNVYEPYKLRLFSCWIHKGFALWRPTERKINARIIERKPYKRPRSNR